MSKRAGSVGELRSASAAIVMRIGCAVCVLMIIPACFHPNYDHPACGPNGECLSGLTCSAQGICGGADEPGSDACTSFASQIDTCQLTFGGDLMLSGLMTYDTGLHELRVNGVLMPVAHMTFTSRTGDVDAIFAHNVRLTTGTGLRALGALPFAIVASGSVTLEEGASIDVGHGGAGAQMSCPNPPMAGADNTGGGGAGGGGGYGASGGDGGSGNLDGTLSPGGVRGSSISMPAGPRGGCPGAHGGAGTSPGGVGGLAGGALYIVAADRIEFVGASGALDAGGGGGHGGTKGTGGAGGGGGGSGGMIWLESPHVLGAHGRLTANGGGGGEGSESLQAGFDGGPGMTSAIRASGGTGGSSDGADGGRGGSLLDPTGETVTALLKAGGGGGGGGVGFVHIVSADVQLELLSPAAN